jgi:hypothetical protein
MGCPGRIRSRVDEPMGCDVRDHRLDDRLKAQLAAGRLTFAIMGEVRRSAVYVPVGAVLIPLIRWRLRDFLPYRGVAELIFGAVLVVSMAVGAICVLALETQSRRPRNLASTPARLGSLALEGV